MPKFEDLTGQRFGRLTVIKRVESSKSGSGRWLCKCDCGNEIIAYYSNLKRGNTKSCGCLFREQIKKPRKEIYIVDGLDGKRFGRWKVISEVNKRGKQRYWLCKCDCGTVKEVNGYSLISGATKSCGCLQIENSMKSARKHGMRKTRLYTVWIDMRDRCENEESPSYKWYGEKGVSVCPEWLGEHGFENFAKWAYEHGYDENARRGDCTIDRIEANGNYEPSNCKWSDSIEQNNHRSSNRFIEYRGEIKTLANWCRELKLPYKTIHSRLNRYGWSIERAFNEPIKK